MPTQGRTRVKSLYFLYFFFFTLTTAATTITEPVAQESVGGGRQLAEYSKGDARIVVQIEHFQCARRLNRVGDPQQATQFLCIDVVAIRNELAREPRQWSLKSNTTKQTLKFRDVTQQGNGGTFTVFINGGYIYSYKFNDLAYEARCLALLDALLVQHFQAKSGEMMFHTIEASAKANFEVCTLMMGRAMEEHRFVFPEDPSSMASPLLHLGVAMINEETGETTDAFALCSPRGDVALGKFHSEAQIMAAAQFLFDWLVRFQATPENREEESTLLWQIEFGDISVSSDSSSEEEED